MATIDIHSFSNYLVSASSVHGTVLGAWGTAVAKEIKVPALSILQSVHFWLNNFQWHLTACRIKSRVNTLGFHAIRDSLHV